ncbi:metal ABC transporter solute-binding protein, Zn/Mn family [Salinispira pacifica]|uniref:Manganese ABC transporter, periplasmic-binding protein SitA n=1 Tax=Salinispira pacifica TaxID=1307761 RepID=V5WDV4_9SPIO|nr:zinc ABC transporter substrate-binding protein [Salinispira pacifica]AHC13967.1 Manganese ABC transporter, periplasmic-binding protein SitA [Salinispira pacifica]
MNSYHTSGITTKTALSVLVLLLSSIIISCGGPDSSAPSSQRSESELRGSGDETSALRIVATTTQAGDLLSILTENVEGVELTKLMGAGVDPHLYQPTERNIAAMNRADMIVYSGLHLEGQFDAVFEALRERGVTIYAMSEPVNRAGFIVPSIDEGEAGSASDDPHFWFDPRNWILTVNGTAELLSAKLPEFESVIMENAVEYTAQLELLYEWALTGLQSVPEGQRYLVTSHDAFQYFGAAFGWKMAAIQGISTQDEAGVGDIEDTVDFVIENSIPVLFVESSIPPDSIEAVIEAIRDRGGDVRIGVRELYGDAMGEAGSFGGSYIGMLASNVLTILQSYIAAGVDITLPEWPGEMETSIPQVMLNYN